MATEKSLQEVREAYENNPDIQAAMRQDWEGRATRKDYDPEMTYEQFIERGFETAANLLDQLKELEALLAGGPPEIKDGTRVAINGSAVGWKTVARVLGAIVHMDGEALRFSEPVTLTAQEDRMIGNLYNELCNRLVGVGRSIAPDGKVTDLVDLAFDPNDDLVDSVGPCSGALDDGPVS